MQHDRNILASTMTTLVYIEYRYYHLIIIWSAIIFGPDNLLGIISIITYFKKSHHLGPKKTMSSGNRHLCKGTIFQEYSCNRLRYNKFNYSPTDQHGPTLVTARSLKPTT